MEDEVSTRIHPTEGGRTVFSDLFPQQLEYQQFLTERLQELDWFAETQVRRNGTPQTERAQLATFAACFRPETSRELVKSKCHPFHL